MTMADSVHSAIMKRKDMEEVPFSENDFSSNHVQLSDTSSVKSRFLPAFVATLVAALGPFNFGFALGYSSPVESGIEKATSIPHLNREEYSWFAVRFICRLCSIVLTNAYQFSCAFNIF